MTKTYDTEQMRLSLYGTILPDLIDDNHTSNDDHRSLLKEHEVVFKDFKGEELPLPGIYSSVKGDWFKYTTWIPATAKAISKNDKKILSLGRAITKILHICSDHNEIVKCADKKELTPDVFEYYAKELIRICTSSFLSTELISNYLKVLEYNAQLNVEASNESNFMLLEERGLFVVHEQLIGTKRTELPDVKHLGSDSKPYVFIPGIGYINVQPIDDSRMTNAKTLFERAIEQHVLNMNYVAGKGLFITMLGRIGRKSNVCRERDVEAISRFAEGGFDGSSIAPSLSTITHEFVLLGVDLSQQDQHVFDELYHMMDFALSNELPEVSQNRTSSDRAIDVRNIYAMSESDRLLFEPTNKSISLSADWWLSILSSMKGVRDNWRILLNSRANKTHGSSVSFKHSVVLRTTLKNKTYLHIPSNDSKRYCDIEIPGLDRSLKAYVLRNSDRIGMVEWYRTQLFFIINPSQLESNQGRENKYDVFVVVAPARNRY